MTTRIRISRALALFTTATLALLSSGLGVGIRPAVTRAASSESPLEAAARLAAATGGQVVIRYAQATGVARFVRATDDSTIRLSSSATSLEDKAFAFFEEYGAVFGVLAAREQLAVTTVTSDDAGSAVRLAQVYGILAVFNAEVIVHFDTAGEITAVNGTFIPGVKVPTTPAISADRAADQALAVVAAELGLEVSALSAEAPVLGVTKAGLAEDVPGAQALAWKTTVTGPAVRQFAFVDALSGEIVEVLNGLPTELNRETYNMLEQSDYTLAQKCRFEGDPPSVDPDCNNAHDFSGDTYHFFFNGFRRDSFDNQGTTLKSFVHFFSAICPNAFWNGQFMTYCTGLAHDDVAGHEIAHGVTEFSANLVYAFQPGALNESFSDIFGESIDLMNSSENEPGSEWEIGEAIPVIGPIRDMSDPTRFGDPDSCTSPNYHCASSDNGGVHINSGVPNKAYYLMVEGGTHNGVTVTGIGIEKAAAVQYRALTRYLSVYSSFVDDYEALQSACRDLRSSAKVLFDPDPEIGGGELQSRMKKADCDQVKNALDAVRMVEPVCANVVPSPAGPLCADGESVAPLFFDDQESGGAGWTASNDPNLYTGQQWAVVSDFTFSGTQAWHINDEFTSCSGENVTSDNYLVSPEVNLAGATRPILRFVHDFFTEGGYDAGSIEINLNGTWTKLEKADFTLNAYNSRMNLDSTAPNWTALSRDVFTGYRTPGQFPALTYAESRVNLSTYLAQDADKFVQFRFRFGTDFCNGTDVGWYLDDVEVYDCKLE